MNDALIMMRFIYDLIPFQSEHTAQNRLILPANISNFRLLDFQDCDGYLITRSFYPKLRKRWFPAS